MSRPLPHCGLAVTRSLRSLQGPRIKSHIQTLSRQRREPTLVCGRCWACLGSPRLALPFSGAVQCHAGLPETCGYFWGPWRGVRFAVGLVTRLLPLQGADGAGVQDEGHAHGQNRAGLPARHRPLQPRYGLRPGLHRARPPARAGRTAAWTCLLFTVGNGCATFSWPLCGSQSGPLHTSGLHEPRFTLVVWCLCRAFGLCCPKHSTTLHRTPHELPVPRVWSLDNPGGVSEGQTCPGYRGTSLSPSWVLHRRGPSRSCQPRPSQGLWGASLRAQVPRQLAG